MKKILFQSGFVLLMLAIASTVVYAQTPTPTAITPGVNLPQGWGPTGPGNEISIQELTGSYLTTVINDPDMVCNAGLQLVRYIDTIIPPTWQDPIAVAKIRVRMSYSDGGYPWPARLRFAFHSLSVGAAPYQEQHCLDIYSYDSDGYTLLDQTVACFCSYSFDDKCDTTTAAPNLGSGDWTNWRIFDNVLTVNDHGYIWIVEPTITAKNFAPFGGFVISGLYIDRATNTFPVLCGNILPDPTAFPTWTPWPTWTPSPTGTLTMTPYPTSAGQTSTPTYTPIPYTTWTPSPSPTVWQSPMATLAAWQITPDASLTPLPTPTMFAPLPTWAPWPTINLPDVPTPLSTVTRIPVFDPETTIIPHATEAQEAAEEAAEEAYELAGQTDKFLDLMNNLLEDDIQGAGNVYTVTYDMTSNILTPLRIVRGLELYLPSLYPMIAFVLAALVWIAIIRISKLGLGVISAILDVIHKIIDTVTP